MKKDEKNITDEELRGVDPMRIAVTKHRATIIKAYLAGVQNTATAQAAADKLGMGLSTFYRFTRAWKLTKQASQLGLTRPKRQFDPPIKQRLTEEQNAVVKRAIEASAETTSIHSIANLALNFGRADNIQMPTMSTIGKAIQLAAPRLLVPVDDNSVVVDAVALGMGVKFKPTSNPVQPVGIFLADASGNVLDLVLHEEPATPAAVKALILHAIESGSLAIGFPPKGQTLATFRINVVSPEWFGLIADLRTAGCYAEPMIKSGVRMSFLYTMRDRTIAGVKMRPRVAWRPSSERAWTPGISLDAPLSVDEATTLLRERMIDSPEHPPIIAAKPPGLIPVAG